MSVFAVGGSFYPYEPTIVPAGGCKTINMLQYLARRVYVGVRNTSTTLMSVAITRKLFDLGEETIIADTIDAGLTKYYVLEGMFEFRICVNQTAEIAFIVEAR